MGTLAFGWNAGLVDGVTAAWGARAIVTQGGTVDIPHDRTSDFGDADAVRAWLQTEVPNYPTGFDPTPLEGPTTVIGKAIANLAGGLRQFVIQTREDAGHVIYQDSTGAVLVNTNASAGYAYITAYRFADLPEGHPTRGLEIALARFLTPEVTA